MSRTSEKSGCTSRWLAIAALALSPALSARASVDQPDAAKLFGNAYHDGGWFSCGTSRHSDGYLLFDTKDEFVLSPRYPAPVRKIVLNVRCSSTSPTKLLLLCPFVDGVEDPARVHTNSTVVAKDKFEIASFDFAAAEGVDAFRLLLGGSGSTGTWGVDSISVFYGAKTPGEDEILRQFARQLPVPENLTLTHLESDALTVSASAVESAVGYCFELTKLTGCPRTELRECFDTLPDLTDGWAFGEIGNASLSSYSGESSSYVDKEISEDRMALKIERKNSTDPVCVEILSPEAPAGEVFRECSYWSKCSSAGSDRIGVYGQVRGTGEWVSLADVHVVTTTKDRQTVALTAEQGVSRIRFVFQADGETCRSCALDSLRVVYGGNEARELDSAQTNATPEAAWQDLASGRYGCRVKALGETEGEKQFKDSAWSDELTVDLAWADIRLSPPEDLAYEVSGDKLNLSWSPVAMADRYEVKVAPADDPENPVATLVTKSASASVPVAELGDYVITVTAVSPGGVSKEKASLENCTVALGKVTGLAVEATAADTIAATWKPVPLAESYQAKLFKVTGEAGTEVSDYSKLSEGVWPDGWEHYSYDTETYSGNPKLKYRDSWIKTESYPQPITEVKFSFKSHVSGTLSEEVTKTYIRVEGSADGLTWTEIAAHQVTTAMQSITEIVPYGDGLRRIRFSVRYDGENPNYTNLNVEFGKVTVSYGAYVRTEAESVGTKECAVTYRGLDKAAKYVVVVTPQPSEGTECEASSVVVDLASEYFRPVGPVSIAGCRGGVYLQGFDSLTNVTKETDLRRVPLENWQFFKGSGEAEKLFYTSGTNSTKGGVYCYSDTNRTTSSFMIGTVATSTMGSSVGLAFVNDRGSALGAPTLTFTAVRRNGKPGEPYRLEWLVTDGPWSIGTESDDWKQLPFTEGMPEFSVTPDDCRLAPGQVIIFRWRQEKVSGGPMLGLDDIHVEFPVEKPGLMLHLR